ncbi:COP9 signalosome complex subunit 8 [Orussus abietinus]|uniref:COP9 signalosome complex subunit 8 n=1 Tax=Orussus abietinus TaxID=222816 RepID=UPI0006261062|nr:COP9 signalosome complex subunit 8 [Orussus abietinus]
MVLTEVGKLISELEKAELEAPNGIATPQTYAQLLALYLHGNDLCHAKYLWKRIPSDVKEANPELWQIWVVGQHMWQRHWPAVHLALKVEWSEDVKHIMNALKENVRERALSLIAEAYSSLSLFCVVRMTGLSMEEARHTITERGWTIDGNTVQPCKADKEQSFSQASLTEDQLNKLTQFVSFLEN